MDRKENMERKREELEYLKQRIESLNRDKRNYESDLRRIRLEYDKADSGLPQAIKDAKERAMKSELDKLKEPFIIEIEELEEKNDSLAELMGRKKKEYTRAEFEEPFENELKIINDCISNVSLAETYVKEHLGERLAEVINSRLSVGKIELGVEDLESISKKLNKYQTNLKLMSRTGKSKAIGKKFGDLMEKLTPCKDETKEGAISNDLIMYTLAVGGVSFLVIKFLSPFLLVSILGLCSYNIYKTYAVYRLLLETKLVQDNTDILKKLISSKVDEQIKQYLEELENAYELSTEKVNNKISQLNMEMEKQINMLESNFQFDSTEVEEKFENNKNRLKDEQTAAERNLADLNKNIDDTMSQLRLAERAYNELADSEKDIRLSTASCGDAIVYPKDILYDMDEDNEGEYWDLPTTPCLILYESRTEVTKFCKLLILQLLNQMVPTAIQMDYIDGKYMAADITELYDLPKGLFNITLTDEIKKLIDAKKETLLLRLKSIGTDTIVHYNEEMIKNDSVIIPYNLLLMLDIDLSILSSQDMKSIIINGSQVGVFSYIFIEEEEFLADESFRLEFLKIADKVSLITKNGKIKRRSKEYYMEC